MMFSALVLAQQRGRKQPEKSGQGRKPVAGVVPPAAKPSPSPAAMVHVALVNPLQPEYMSGEANVTVRGNQNPIIRLGLAQNGVNVIEFAAADSFFMSYPGDCKL